MLGKSQTSVRKNPNKSKSVFKHKNLRNSRMAKVTIDKETFKALASDVRLEILKVLDGRKMNLSEIARKTGLSKTTVLEHMNKLVQADLVKKIEREGHKWTYYKLSWKGSSLLHPDNTKIVITFCLSFLFLLAGIAQIIIYGNGFYIDIGKDMYVSPTERSLNDTLVSNETGNITIPYNHSMIPFSEKKLKNIAKNHTILNQADNVCYAFNQDSNYTSGEALPEEESNTTGNQVYMSPDGGESIPNLKIFFQDPFYLYCGVTFLIFSVVLLLITFRRLWNRKPAF